MAGIAHSSTATGDVVLAAARLMLADGGVRGLTIEGVAARTGIAKTTIYRRYRSKQELALAVVRQMTTEVVAVDQGGNTRDGQGHAGTRLGHRHRPGAGDRVPPRGGSPSAGQDPPDRPGRSGSRRAQAGNRRRPPARASLRTGVPPPVAHRW